MNPTTSALHAVLIETRGWFENQAKAVSKGCGSSYELHDLQAQRDALDVALAASTQPAAPAQAVEYPPLPKTDRIGRVFDGKFIVGNCHLYEIHQMRAYVDADRAARVAAQASPSGPAREPLTDEKIKDMLKIGNPDSEECRLIRMGWDAAQKSNDARKPLRDHKAYGVIDKMGWQLDDNGKDDMLKLLRAIEAAHGITSKAEGALP